MRGTSAVQPDHDGREDRAFDAAIAAALLRGIAGDLPGGDERHDRRMLPRRDGERDRRMFEVVGDLLPVLAAIARGEDCLADARIECVGRRGEGRQRVDRAWWQPCRH